MFKKFVLLLILCLILSAGLMFFVGAFYLIAQHSINKCDTEACGSLSGSNPVVTPLVDANGILYYIAHTTLYAFQDRSGTLLWRYTNSWLDHDTPVVSDGRVYMDMNIESSNDVQNGEWIYALNGGTGQVLWRTRVSISVPDITPAEPRVVGGIVYAQSSGDLYGSSVFALRATDGKLLWSENSGGPDGASPKFLLATSQIAYLASYSSHTGYLLARRAGNGVPLWHYSFPSCNADGGPILNNTLYITTTCANGGETEAIQAETGKLLWRFTLPDGMITATPTSTIVYVNNTANHSPGFNRFFALDAITGQLLWKRDIPLIEPGIETHIWAVNEDAIYTTINGIWTVLAARDGKQLWQIPSGEWSDPNSTNLTSMQAWMLSPTQVYTAGYEHLNAFQSNTGKLIWHFSLTDVYSWDSILFSQGIIYLNASMFNQQGVQQDQDKQVIYAIQANTGKVLWHTTGVVQGQAMTQYGAYFAMAAGQPYHYTYSVLALQASSGKSMWAYQT